MARPLRVLIIEDSPEDAAIVLRELKRAGYDVLHERVDTEAGLLAALEHQPWDIVLSDFSMPEFNGLHAFELIKEREIEIPFIFVSGRIGEDRAAEAMKRGASDYILKDKLARLAPAVERELRDSEVRRQRRQMALALEESEQRFRAIIENALDVIVVLDTGGTFRLVSPSAQTQLGYAPEELQGQSALALVHPEDVPRVQATLAEVLQAPGNTARTEFRHRHKDGSWRHFEVIGKNLLAMPAIGGLLGILRDITARKRAEEELAASQRLLRTVFDALPHTVVVKDTESRYLMVNRAWCETYGVAAEQAAGRHTLEIPGRPEEDKLRALEEDRELLDAAEPRTFLRTSTVKSGERRHFHDIRTPLRDERGKVTGLVGIAVDLTAEYEARHKADLAYARLHDAIESLPAGFLLFDSKERLVVWNSRVRDFLPHLYDSLAPGTPFEDFLRGEAEQVEAGANGREDWLQSRLARFRSAPGATEVRYRDGRWVQVLEHRTSEDGAVSLRFDVSELKHREQELRQAQKMEAVGRLAGGIAHDFNNMLAVMSSYGELTLDQLGENNAARKDVQVMLDATVRAAALTRQLLAFSRRQVLELKILDINRVVSNIERMLLRVIGEDIHLRTHLGSDIGAIKADESQIEQIIMNLAVNARDAMPTGGTLTIETTRKQLDQHYVKSHLDVKPGDYAMLAVTDTGTGMDEETQRRIFEPFFTTKPLGKGTGLGLATVYGIVKQMEGQIYVYSEIGKGTCFKVYFPLVEPAVRPELPAAKSSVQSRGNETILLVEDDEFVREAARRILASGGYQVLVAHHGRHALELAQEHRGRIDLLLSDVVMPGLSGKEVADGVAQFGVSRVLFMSGYTDDSIVNHGILEGDFPFLHKPFSKDALLTKVREVLGSPVARLAGPTGGSPT